MWKSLLLCSWLSLPALAQGTPQVIILPLDISGNYAPVDEDQLTVSLKNRLTQLAPTARLQVARSAELSAFQMPPGSDHPPSNAQADQIARSYGSKTVTWISLHFTPHLDAQSNTLALAGAARVWAYSSEKRYVTLDEPLSLVRTAVVQNLQDETACRQLAVKLTEDCLDDLALQLVSMAQHQQQAVQVSPPPSVPTPPPTFKGSNYYNQMVRAIRDYQRAERSQDAIDLNSSCQQMTSLWSSLNADEQGQITKTYPSIAKMLNEPGAWGVPYFRRPVYWPYYYNY